MKLRITLSSLCVLLAGAAVRPAAAANEAWYFPDGMLYVPHVNLQDNNGDTVTNYAAFFKKSGVAWNFMLYGLAPVATNSATVTVTGTWDFIFNEAGSRTYTATGFAQTNYMAPISTNCTLTLAQTGSVVEGTGTVSSVQYQLSGEVTNGFFAFTLLAGTTNSKITLAEVRALVGDDVITGDYSWSTADGTKVQFGDFTANKH